MKHIYNIVFSDIKGKPVDHLPITSRTNFRSAKRAFNYAEKLRAEGRDVTVIERCDLGMIATWEFPGGTDLMVFDCDEEICRQLDMMGVA